jgi:hypothetical protein
MKITEGPELISGEAHHPPAGVELEGDAPPR